MKPVLIISHVACEHSGYLCEFLDHRNIPYKKLFIERGQSFPDQIENIAGIVLLGSPVSVNDNLPWIQQEIALVQLAISSKVPVLGICFGAQLIARAAGGEVCAAPSMQIGWHTVKFTEQGRSFLAADVYASTFEAFEWHGDTFSIPHESIPLFTGTCIKNQGFIYKNCLALQFHPEINETMAHEWINRYANCLGKNNKCIQSKSQMLKYFSQRLEKQRLVADQLFKWWLDRVSEYIASSIE